MRILVTGATGFIGNHVIKDLLAKQHEVVASSTSTSKARTFDWFEKVDFREYRLGLKDKKDEKDEIGDKENLFEYFQRPEVMIHLAWEGLPNYKSSHHIEQNLFAHYAFLKNLVDHGLKNLTVTGTCFEYGMQSGPLSEELQSQPNNPYALAKDTLRRFLETLKSKSPFHLKWIRLFYMYGDGQNVSSILPQLQKAIDSGETEFKMSGGEQLRDYLPVSTVASNIVSIALQQSVEGIINCCSGKPISVRKLAENYIQEKGSKIRLCLGHYPYPDYEPMAFWGDNKKLNKILSSHD